MYKRKNVVERLFRRLKGHRRIFSRFEKLDVMFLGVIGSNPVADGLRLCCAPSSLVTGQGLHCNTLLVAERSRSNFGR